MRLPNWPRWVWRYYAATAAALAAFVMCSLLPMWEVTRAVTDGDCGQYSGGGRSLWGMLRSDTPGDYSDQVLCHVVTWHWEAPAVITALSVHIAAILGAILGGIRWRKGE